MNAPRKFLFFDLEITGHHVEYLYHLINYRVAHPNCGDFILVVHPEFMNHMKGLELPDDWKSHGVSIVTPSQEEMQKLWEMRSMYKRAAAEFKILCEIVYRYHVEQCYLMMLNKFQFAVGSRLAHKLPCAIRGILFNPFGMVRNGMSNWVTTLRKHFQMMWMSRNRRLEHIYILNDCDLVNCLNRKYYRPNFFVSLPDPILILSNGASNNVISLPVKSAGVKRFLLFGSLSMRKGIFMVLDALRLLPDMITNQVEVVFAGKVVEQNRESFLTALDNLKCDRPELGINYLDKFVPYINISELFSKSDCILAPYEENHASSGVLGHAALYKQPVIGPDCGLVGKLIRTYGLGTSIAAMDAEKLANAITDFSKNKKTGVKPSGMERFVEERHPTRFVETLLLK